MREYNKAYNYFAGLPDEEVVKHQKDDTIGHRPTWFIGVNPWAQQRGPRNGARAGGFAHRFATVDPFNLFAERAADKAAAAAAGAAAEARSSENACASSISRTTPPRPRSRRASRSWLSGSIPTTTGGDRRSEDKLREVIQAYNYLRQAGLA